MTFTKFVENGIQDLRYGTRALTKNVGFAFAEVATIALGRRTNTAIFDNSGQVILRTAKPGQLGTLGLRLIYGPGRRDFDANLQKRVRFAESKSVSIRIDASNLFNHPTPGNPNLNLNTGTFGEISTKTGFRTLAGQVRLEF
jgi:hypothetical protein